jgi:hypothetical protein
VVLTRGPAEVASWPLARGCRPDLAVVDELARLSLAARRLGCSIWLRDACEELAELLELVGLGLGLEVVGEAEGGEQGRVAVNDEVVEPGDPLA